jgi:hypothetical protein
MGISYAEIMAYRKARSKRRSNERKEVLKTPPKHYMMFIDCSHKDLVNLLHKLIEKKLSSNIRDEIDEQGIRIGGPETRTVQFSKLTRDDLLKVIYSIISDEIQRIDGASIEDLLLLINEEWVCPQLKERLLCRLRGGECRT